QVLGEHGTSSVFLWSGARVAGTPVTDTLAQRQEQIEREVRFANITIIEGNGASIYGIAMVSARIAQAVLRDEGLVVPIGSYRARYGVTLSLPGLLGRSGVTQTFEPAMSDGEREKLEKSAGALREALSSL
ncbi:MAG: lactate dehydrogenase, partial [Alphaproteobacteria bacterium]|nr:lactate dehydrogenase [Alphaproteobacteria bacterium]